MMMSCVGFEVYKFSEPPLLVQQFFQSPLFRCLKILGAPPQNLHPPPPLLMLNELSLSESISKRWATLKTEVVGGPSYSRELKQIQWRQKTP